MFIIKGLNSNQSSIDVETQFLKFEENWVEPKLFKPKWSGHLLSGMHLCSLLQLFTPHCTAVS